MIYQKSTIRLVISNSIASHWTFRFTTKNPKTNQKSYQNLPRSECGWQLHRGTYHNWRLVLSRWGKIAENSKEIFSVFQLELEAKLKAKIWVLPGNFIDFSLFSCEWTNFVVPVAALRPSLCKKDELSMQLCPLKLLKQVESFLNVQHLFNSQHSFS